MNQIIIALTILVSFPVFVPDADAQSYDQSAYMMASQAKEIALREVADAYQKTGNRNFGSVLQALNRSQFVVSHSREGCVPGTSAYTHLGADFRHIFLCPIGILQNPNDIVSILIHESTHLTGIENECAADSIRVEIERVIGVQGAMNRMLFSMCGPRYRALIGAPMIGKD